MGKPWDDDAELAALRRLWMVDGLSAGLCGMRLGRSRNSIIGKVDRMGWTRGTAFTPSASLPRPARVVVAKPKTERRSKQHPGPSFVTPNWQQEGPKPPTIVEIGDMDRTDGLRIMDDGFGGCRWPIGGEGADCRFCCLPSAGKPYCEAHERRSAHASQPVPREDAKLFKWLAKKAA